jgi:hypothetical protein
MAKVTYLGPHDVIEIPALNWQSVQRNHSIDVPDELAGREPSGEPGDDGYDPGEGLLAQSESWRVKKTPVKSADKEGS